MNIWFCGDVHGQFDHVLQAHEQTPMPYRPQAVIFLGDLEAQEPLDKIFASFLDVGLDPWFIHGNHDSDHTKEWNHLQTAWERNLHGRVETIAGVRVAGLGGVFRGEIWYPEKTSGSPDNTIAATHQSFDEYINYLKSIQPLRLRKDVLSLGQARKHSTTIFPAVVENLSRQRADVLVTHEAPSCHKNGFAVIDELARSMKVKALFHGHHHRDEGYGNALGFDAYQVGFRGIRNIDGSIVKVGDYE